MLTQNDITGFFKRQLESWPEAAARFEALKTVGRKVIDIDGFAVTVICNASRKGSSAAKVDKASIAARPCFLCDSNRPPEQLHLDWNGYKILVNPFPIMPVHFTIVANEHRPQSIRGAIGHMKLLSAMMPDFAIFYNGPRCGASAPDHFHFQAVEKSHLPIFKSAPIPFGVIDIDGTSAGNEEFDRLIEALPIDQDETEPKINIFCTTESGRQRIIVIPRRRHRPDFYGENGLLMSPASIDLGGVMVTVRQSDFNTVNKEILKDIYSQLCYTQSQADEFIKNK